MVNFAYHIAVGNVMAKTGGVITSGEEEWFPIIDYDVAVVTILDVT